MFRWLRRLLLGRPHPRPGFRFECLSDGWWLCRICQRRVLDVQLGMHARKFHNWRAPGVHIDVV